MIRQPYDVARFRKALAYFISGRAVQALARALLVLVLVRLLDVGDFGAYMLMVGLSEMLPEVVSFGLLPVGQRYLPQMVTTLSARKLFRFVSTITLLQLAILCLITAGLWHIWHAVTPLMGFSAEQVAATRPALWLFLLVPAFRFCADMLEALLEQGKSQIANAVMPMGRLLAIGLLLLLNVAVDLPNVILIDIAVTAFCMVLSWTLLAHSLKSVRPSQTDGEIPVREMLRFAWHMAPVGLMGATASPGAIRLALANAIGVSESGLFAFLQSLQRLVGRYLPGTLLRGLIRPMLLARAFGPEGQTVMEAGTGLLLKSNLLMVAAGSVVIAVCGNALVAWASGGKFLDAGLTLFLMFLALAFTAQRSVIEMVMQITGHTAALRATATIAPLALAVIWMFADLGLNIAILIIAGASALSNWLAMAVLIHSTKGFNVDWRGLVAIVMPSAATIGCGILLRMQVDTVFAAVIALVLFIVLVWLLKPFHRRELMAFERAAGRRAAVLMRYFSRTEAP